MALTKSTKQASAAASTTARIPWQLQITGWHEVARSALPITASACSAVLQQTRPAGQDELAHLDGLLLPIEVISTFLVIFLLL